MSGKEADGELGEDQECWAISTLRRIVERHPCDKCMELHHLNVPEKKSIWKCWVCGKTKENELRF
jgi:hypothetical protein